MTNSWSKLKTCTFSWSNFIKCYHPKWYKEKYGDIIPEQAIQVEDGCIDQMRMDPEEEYYCYDNEDK